MDNSIKKKMAKQLAEWLLKDFEIIIDPPTEADICQNLEKQQEKD